MVYSLLHILDVASTLIFWEYNEIHLLMALHFDWIDTVNYGYIMQMMVILGNMLFNCVNQDYFQVTF